LNVDQRAHLFPDPGSEFGIVAKRYQRFAQCPFEQLQFVVLHKIASMIRMTAKAASISFG
jgi:hypothetical protein